MPASVLITPPVDEPIILEQAKAHLRVTTTAEDDLIEALIEAARTRVEEEIKRALITQTWELVLDSFEDPRDVASGAATSTPRIIALPRPPLQSVLYVSYTDGDNATQTLYSTAASPVETSSLVVDAKSSPGRIAPIAGGSWPTAVGQINAITIRYVAGYGNSGDSVPAPIKQAILLTLGHLYEHREDVTEVQKVMELPRGARYLLETYRVISIP